MLDIPSPIDLRRPDHAQEWAKTALQKRPWRPQFFQHFVQEIQAIPSAHALHILELGSGPGFLLKELLGNLPKHRYSALDFSQAMHDLARERLGEQAEQVNFLVRDFKQDDWFKDLTDIDVVITNQAVHELRHKRHAPALHAQVRQLLKPQGIYLVCDHFAGTHEGQQGMQNNELFMTVEEQQQALAAGGFNQVKALLCQGSLMLWRAYK
jgi:SAM-dependent methyltransferase